MNILCVNYEYPPIGGGGGAACKGLAEELVQMGHSVDVVTSGMHDLPAVESLSGVDIHRVRCWRRHRHYVTLPEMATELAPAFREAMGLSLNSHSFAINHTHFIVPSGLVSYRLWRRLGLPYVITIHGSDVPGYNPDRFQWAHVLLMPLWRRIVRGAAALIVPSAFLKGLVETYVPDVHVEVVPYGIEFPPLQGREKRNRILVVTRMFPRKGVQFVLEAMDAVGPGWELHVAGDGPYLPELRKRATELQVPVHFHGFVRGAELWDLYESAKIFVFPSLQENFPVVLLEAMWAGCAVVTTAGTGCAEVVQNAALKTTPGSVDELRQALRKLTAEPESITHLARLGRERVASLCPRAIAQRHIEIFSRHAA